MERKRRLAAGSLYGRGFPGDFFYIIGTQNLFDRRKSRAAFLVRYSHFLRNRALPLDLQKPFNKCFVLTL
jgi:hypothetical protein